jgi:APA family basic amino acid/polyamine antiporter
VGFWGATGIGVGAIVGGGILALAGVAYSATGPGAVLAFGINGIIALMTALSFAELATRFPQSGGPYTFAKKVYSVEAAFLLGWIVWFASLVAAALYAIGFGEFFILILLETAQMRGGTLAAALQGQTATNSLALLALVGYTILLVRRTGGGAQWATIGKTVVFLVLIAAGIFALTKRPDGTVAMQMRPLLPHGLPGLFQAMGFTFIALQGFGVIGAIAGEVRNPRRTIPRAMFASLGIALLIYLPLLILIPVVGIEPGTRIEDVSQAAPESVVATAARGFMGPTGTWLVLVAGVLAMLSALHANLLAASQVALAMGRDRTLPALLGTTHERRGTPVQAVIISSAIVLLLVLAIPDVAVAGAAASLIFLIVFTLVHVMAWLSRRRSSSGKEFFQTPFYPVIPILGSVFCVALTLFQGRAVPIAGQLTIVWIGIGGILYLVLFASRARIRDAAMEAVDPEIAQLRGKSPLVLVPVSNPANAACMVEVGSALAPPRVGRVLLLSVVTPPVDWDRKQAPPQLINAQNLMREVLDISFQAGLRPDALTTLAEDPWTAIERVARRHRCESLLLGFSQLDEQVVSQQLEGMLGRVPSDIAVLRSPPGWRFSSVRRVLVPIGGRSGHEQLRSRLVGSLLRSGVRDITFLRILPHNVPERVRDTAVDDVRHFFEGEMEADCRILVLRDDDVAGTVAREAESCDLLILGLQRHGRNRKVFGSVTLEIARQTSCAILMISSRG